MVDLGDLLFGAGDQLLKMRGDIRNEVVLQQLTLAGGQQPFAVGEILGELDCQRRGSRGTRLVGDGDHEPIVGQVRRGVVAMP